MRTDELIDVLARDASPVARGTVRRSLMIAVGCAAAVSLAILLGWLGMRPDIHTAMRTMPFWMKATYTLALAASGFWLTYRLARPEGRTGRAWALPLLVIAVLAGLSAIELAGTPRADWRALVMGHSWTLCPIRILAISAPVFALAMWALRRLAPTRLMLAGAAAGLLAGGVGATVYGLACDETAATFTLTWYTLAIGLSAGLGALLGRRLLAWR
jgi:hypothetical protein